MTVRGEASGDYGGFPLLPWALTSGSFAASGTITADFVACSEVRLANKTDQCIYSANGGPAATDVARTAG